MTTASFGWAPLIGGMLGALDANNQPNSMTLDRGGTSSSVLGTMMPSQITGPAAQALASLQRLYAQGSRVAGVPQLMNTAVNRLGNLGTNQFATGNMNNTAPTTSSFANGQTINPYLDQVFNTAANSTQNRQASEFAHAGMLNTPNHQGSRSQELQNLAAGIYGPGFEAERARQYGAQEVGVARALDQARYNLTRQNAAIEGNLGREMSAASQMFTAGDYLRQIEQMQLDAPWLNQQRYQTGLQGMLPFYPAQRTQATAQTGAITQPLFSNPLVGFLGGATLGSLFT
jgi:hypothetical protein